MRKNELKKLTISALFLVANNPSNDDSIRKEAEKLLRNRIRNLGYDYDSFAQDEYAVIEKRGLDLNNYLIGPKPSMQQLMQLYFRVHNNCDPDGSLLFSETHLCNEYDNPRAFFSSICRLEVANIEDRMDNNEASTALQEAYNILLSRVLNARKGGSFGIADIDSVAEQDVFSYGLNMSEEEKNRISSSPILRVGNAVIGKIDSTIMQTDIGKWVYFNNLLLQDRLLLSEQKRRLKRQASNGYYVNYDSEQMADALRLHR